MASTIGNVTLGESGRLVERHWQELNARRKMYTALGLALLAVALSASLWFANETMQASSSTGCPTSSTSSGISSRATGWNDPGAVRPSVPV